MKKNSILVSEIPELTIGLDLSDRTFQFCELNAKGEIVKEGQLKLDRATLRKYLACQPSARVALETGGQSAWVKQVIEELGHQAVVANARELEAVQLLAIIIGSSRGCVFSIGKLEMNCSN